MFIALYNTCRLLLHSYSFGDLFFSCYALDVPFCFSRRKVFCDCAKSGLRSRRWSARRNRAGTAIELRSCIRFRNFVLNKSFSMQIPEILDKVETDWKPLSAQFFVLLYDAHKNCSIDKLNFKIKLVKKVLKTKEI